MKSKPISSEEAFYSLKEVSTLLKVAYLTVYRWVKSGHLSAYRVQKQYRIKKEDLDLFIKKQQISS
ncbi:helix-turn-helix domain-containing protein [Patescibacteria group bacterium]|nr:helix-turn-helix domain-containing protein [Patescibacteria group bacterium]